MEKTAAIFHAVENKLPHHGKTTPQFSTSRKENFHTMEKPSEILHTTEKNLPHHGKKSPTPWKTITKSSTAWK
jgi:hypothetical protein